MRKSEYTCDYCGQAIVEKEVTVFSFDTGEYLWYELHKECKTRVGREIKEMFIYRTDRKSDG